MALDFNLLWRVFGTGWRYTSSRMPSEWDIYLYAYELSSFTSQPLNYEITLGCAQSALAGAGRLPGRLLVARALAGELEDRISKHCSVSP